jgi:hypothetical protein
MFRPHAILSAHVAVARLAFSPRKNVKLADTSCESECALKGGLVFLFRLSFGKSQDDYSYDGH